jgi:hypothetical protein
MQNGEPLPTASNGRTRSGRFGKGNTFGKGNPNLRRIHLLRNRLLQAVDGDAMTQIGTKLVEMAKSGDLDAMRVLFTFTIGRPPQAIELCPSDTPHPLYGVSEEECEARIERVNARIAEFDKRCPDTLNILADTPPRSGVNDAARARHPASRTPEAPDQDTR